jgi:hypothetical protein
MGERRQIDGWTVVLIQQLVWAPFLPWCALATRKVGNKIQGFNVEGTNKADALRRVQLMLSQGEGSD